MQCRVRPSAMQCKVRPSAMQCRVRPSAMVTTSWELDVPTWVAFDFACGLFHPNFLLHPAAAGCLCDVMQHTNMTMTEESRPQSLHEEAVGTSLRVMLVCCMVSQRHPAAAAKKLRDNVGWVSSSAEVACGQARSMRNERGLPWGCRAAGGGLEGLGSGVGVGAAAGPAASGPPASAVGRAVAS